MNGGIESQACGSSSRVGFKITDELLDDNYDHIHCRWHTISWYIDKLNLTSDRRYLFLIVEEIHPNPQERDCSFEMHLALDTLWRWSFHSSDLSLLSSWSQCDSPVSNRNCLGIRHQWCRHDNPDSNRNRLSKKVQQRPRPLRFIDHVSLVCRHLPLRQVVCDPLRRSTLSILPNVHDQRIGQRWCFRIDSQFERSSDWKRRDIDDGGWWPMMCTFSPLSSACCNQLII